MSKIGFFFKSKHLGSWLENGGFNFHLPLSGTDRPLLWLASELQKKNFKVLIFTDNPPVRSNLTFLPAFDATDALQKAAHEQVDLFIVSNLADSVVARFFTMAAQVKQKVLVWDQNGPSSTFLKLARHTSEFSRLVCVSSFQADCIRADVCFSRTSVIYNAIDSDFWSPGNQPKLDRVIYVGALTQSKGFDLVAEAWIKFREENPGVELHVCGSAKLYDREVNLGPLGVAEEKFEKERLVPHLGESRAHAFERGVIFHGLVGPSQIRDLARSSKMGIVNPRIKSAVETFCVSAVELQACGIPVIGGADGGLLETIDHGSSGLLCSPARLSETITKLYAAVERTNRWQKNARQKAIQFHPNIISKKWETLIASLLAGESPVTPAFHLKPLRPKRYARQLLGLLQRLKRPI